MLKNKAIMFNVSRGDINLLSLFIFFFSVLFVTCEFDRVGLLLVKIMHKYTVFY